jgi:hypothetical protein
MVWKMGKKKVDPNHVTKACPKKPNAQVPYHFYRYGKGMQKGFYWFTLLLCGVLGFFISLVSLSWIGFEPAIIAGVVLGVILTYKFRLDKRQTLKAGVFSGVIFTILHGMLWFPVGLNFLSYGYINEVEFFFSIFELGVSPLVIFVLTTLITSILLRGIFKIES